MNWVLNLVLGIGVANAQCQQATVAQVQNGLRQVDGCGSNELGLNEPVPGLFVDCSGGIIVVDSEADCPRVTWSGLQSDEAVKTLWQTSDLRSVSYTDENGKPQQCPEMYVAPSRQELIEDPVYRYRTISETDVAKIVVLPTVTACPVNNGGTEEKRIQELYLSSFNKTIEPCPGIDPTKDGKCRLDVEQLMCTEVGNPCNGYFCGNTFLDTSLCEETYCN